MAEYFLLCTFTDQGVRTVKDVPNRRAAAREMAKKLGVELKGGYMALGAYDLIIHAEAPSDEAMAKFVLSLSSKGNLKTTTVRVFGEQVTDDIVGALA